MLAKTRTCTCGGGAGSVGVGVGVLAGVGVGVGVLVGVGVGVGGGGGTHTLFEVAESQVLCSSQPLTLALYQRSLSTFLKMTLPEEGAAALL